MGQSGNKRLIASLLIASLPHLLNCTSFRTFCPDAVAKNGSLWYNLSAFNVIVMFSILWYN
jgi:hypothetical protein